MRVGFDLETHPDDSSVIQSIQIYYPERDLITVYHLETNKAWNVKPEIWEISEPFEVVWNDDMRKSIEELELVGHYLQSDDLVWFKRFGTHLNVVGDSYLAAMMTGQLASNLEDLCVAILKRKIKDRLWSDMQWRVWTNDNIIYAAKDPYAAWLCEQEMQKRYPKQLRVPYSVECQMIPLLVEMEHFGMLVDMPTFSAKLDELETKLTSDLIRLTQLAGRSFKLGSPKDLQRLLYEEHKLPKPPIRTSTGAPSTNQEALAYLEGNELVDGIVEAKSLQNVVGSMRSQILEKGLIDGNGYVHPRYNSVAISGGGRIYTENPSTNQWPIALRKAVKPAFGKKFVYLDVKAGELITVAVFGGQQDLIDLYYEGKDLHRYVASKILGVSQEEITEEMREVSKVVTFSIIFGSEGAAAARALRVPLSVAEGYVRKFREMFPKIEQFRLRTNEKVLETGYAITPLGRYRRIPEAFSSSKWARAKAERKAFNTVCQTGLADFMKVGMVRLHRSLKEALNGVARIVTTVFDSILLEVPEEMQVSEYLSIVEKVLNFKVGVVEFSLRVKTAEAFDWGTAQGR